MPNYQELYQEKLCTPVEAIKLVQDGDFLIVPTGVGEPPALLTALSEHRREYHGVKVFQILPLRRFGYIDPETVDHVRHVAYFLGGATRAGAQEGWIDYIPSYFSKMPRMIEDGLLTVDTVFTICSPMDEHGYFSISLAPDYTMAAIKEARTVVVEVNPNVPFANGNCLVHISEVTAIVEDDTPLTEVGLPEIGPVQEAIGKYVADLINDGSTIQIGFGAIPDAVVMQLTNKHDLGIHSEMFGDGILTLIESGVVTNRKKNYLPGKVIATFALGTKRLYDFMNRNPHVEMHPVNFTNDPCLAGKNDNLVTINASIQVDFLGQCCSESMGSTPYSGTGGQSDFVRSANRSKGGKSFIVLPSTAKNGTISRITPILTAGSAVTTSKNDVNYVVTEYGVAQLQGKSAKERAHALIAIAHPDFREELTAAAEKMNLC
ncbi:acetyl-CoA hydrolase/transferase family protein [Desulfosporosinus fructosivorans]|uniref:Acetyl-CoA hydrolase/transferase family protein n=1 Tax=Desulfosporosinus fructosivorans TaxID=2018669 RepID=A0A4Z0R7B6_9FIRM|nr:acetyl-CoA hydrolase/transferase C-terminal domain-containing protein [Desulfosporosinus fructosivorans]TGE38982.1 acetyl-CoA hydrolase/transferase family protein [Desulfosporosinus fructosivorans]